MAKNNLNIQPENRLIVSHVEDIIKQTLKKHILMFSDFFTPSQAEDVIKTAEFQRDVNFAVFGGNDECERRIIGFCPDYAEITNQDFPIDAVKISYNKKFSTEMSHRDYLGSILGLGIDRSKVGDILVFDGSAICYVKREMAEYISANLNKVGHNNVRTDILALNEVVLPELKTEEKSFTVSSLRIDAVAGGAFNMARGKIQSLIEGEKVFLNFVTQMSPSKNISENDMISVRGFGRVKVLSVNGRTKKDRISITVLKYI